MQKVFGFLMVFFGLAGNVYSQTGDTIVFGSVIDIITKKPIANANICIMGKSDTIKLTANNEGKYFVTKKLLKEGESYLISCGLIPYYIIKIGRFTLYPKYPDAAIEQNFVMDPVMDVAGDLPRIGFFKDQTQIVPKDTLFLNHLIKLLKENPNIVLEVAGFADFREKNPKKLSEKRAHVIADYIIEEGIDSLRVPIKWYGSSQAAIVEYDHGVFKNGDVLDKRFVNRLRDPEAIEESIRLNGSAQFIILRHDYKPSK